MANKSISSAECQFSLNICITAPSFSVTLPDTEAGEVAAPVRLPNVFRWHVYSPHPFNRL